MELAHEQRLRTADPVGHLDAAQQDRDLEWLDRASAAAATRPSPRRVPRTSPGPSRRRALAGAVALAVASSVVALVIRGTGGDVTTPAPSATGPTVTAIALAPATPTMSSCIPFSEEVLGQMPIAFSGSVTAVDEDAILIAVDTWFRGPGSDQVRLEAPSGALTSLGEGVDFRLGERYLVTATAGTVNYCGYTGPWSQSLADSYTAAFGGSE